MSKKRKALAQLHRRYTRRRARVRAVKLAYLLTHPCVDCGEGDPVVLQFDHVRRELKRADVSKLSTVSAVVREMALCEVRCANCHLRKTVRDKEYYPARVTVLERTQRSLFAATASVVLAVLLFGVSATWALEFPASPANHAMWDTSVVTQGECREAARAVYIFWTANGDYHEDVVGGKVTCIYKCTKGHTWEAEKARREVREALPGETEALR